MEGTFGEDPTLLDYPPKVALWAGVTTVYYKLPWLAKLKFIIVACLLPFSRSAYPLASL